MKNSLMVLRYNYTSFFEKFGKSYLGSIAASFFVAFLLRNQHIVSSYIVLLGAIIYVNQVFDYQRYNGADKLFGALPLKQIDVIRGHYLFIWINSLVALSLASVAFSMVGDHQSSSLQLTYLMYAMVCIMQSFMLYFFLMSGSIKPGEGTTPVWVLGISCVIGAAVALLPFYEYLEARGLSPLWLNFVSFATGGLGFLVSYLLARRLPRDCSLPYLKQRG